MSQSKEVGATEPGEEELPKNKVLDHLGLVAGMFEELESAIASMNTSSKTSTSARSRSVRR